MKKEYKLADGGEFTATSSEDLVAQMMDSSRFDESSSIEAYMIRFADRYKLASGQSINTATPEMFISDLIACGYIK